MLTGGPGLGLGLGLVPGLDRALVIQGPDRDQSLPSAGVVRAAGQGPALSGIAPPSLNPGLRQGRLREDPGAEAVAEAVRKAIRFCC
eukprot:m.19103 g.19103  ORF g.19103 m.19103 type:complete len:87 (+) comp27785_c0_seq6:1436-1696(+)